MVIINREHGVYPGLYAFDRLLIGNAANADIDSSNVCPGSFVQQEQADGKVSVRSRYLGDEGQKPLSEFVDAIVKEIATKEIKEIKVESNNEK